MHISVVGPSGESPSFSGMQTEMWIVDIGAESYSLLVKLQGELCV